MIALITASISILFLTEPTKHHLLTHDSFIHAHVHLHPFKHARYLLCIVNLSRVDVPHLCALTDVCLTHRPTHTFFLLLPVEPFCSFRIFLCFSFDHSEKRGTSVLLN